MKEDYQDQDYYDDYGSGDYEDDYYDEASGAEDYEDYDGSGENEGDFYEYETKYYYIPYCHKHEEQQRTLTKDRHFISFLELIPHVGTTQNIRTKS